MDLIHNRCLARCANTVFLAFCSLAGLHLPGENADESSWYSRELPGLARYYLGWFGAVRASEEGIVFTGGDFSLVVLGMHDPRKPKTKFSPLDWILKAGTEVTVPLGTDVSFIHAEAVRFQLTPLSGELEQWGFMAMFRARVRLRGDPVVDRALILLLRERDGPDRRICVLPNDLELARQIIADGGYVPRGATAIAQGVFVLAQKSPTTLPGVTNRMEPNQGSLMGDTPASHSITTNARTEAKPDASDALGRAAVISKKSWLWWAFGFLILIVAAGILFKLPRK